MFFITQLVIAQKCHFSLDPHPLSFYNSRAEIENRELVSESHTI